MGSEPKAPRICALLVLAVVLMWSGPLFAGSGGDDTERAQEYFEDGAEHYLEQNYSRAIIEFRKAHQASPHPIFLHNIALANLHLGRVDNARDAASKAASMDISLPDDTTARNLGIIAGADTASSAHSTAERVDRRGTSPTAEASTDEVVEPPPETDASPAFGALGLGGLAALSAGFISLGGALYVDRQIAAHRDALEARAGRISPTTMDEQVEHIDTWQTRGRILLFSGIGLAAAGTALVGIDVFAGSDTSSTSGLTIFPSPSAQGPAVMFQW